MYVVFVYVFFRCANFGFASTKKHLIGSWMGRDIQHMQREKGRPCVDIGKTVLIFQLNFKFTLNGILLPRYIPVEIEISVAFQTLPLCNSSTESDNHSAVVLLLVAVLDMDFQRGGQNITIESEIFVDQECCCLRLFLIICATHEKILYERSLHGIVFCLDSVPSLLLLLSQKV